MLVLGVLLSLAPFTWAAESTDPEPDAEPADAGIPPYNITADIPLAKDIEHVHNSEGWTCARACGLDGHAHTVECYELVCGKEETEGHTHTVECYELVCGKEETEGHTHDESCYAFESEPVCGLEESEGHTHNNECYRICGKEEIEAHHHTDDCGWNCATDYVLLTVEYYVLVDNQQVRIAETFQSLLTKGTEYLAPIEYLKEKGYAVKEILCYNPDNLDPPLTIAFDEDAGVYTVPGTIETDTKLSVEYEYTDELAPYRVDYWGCDANGQNEELIYSYTSIGPKDIKIAASETEVNATTIPLKVSELMQNLSGILKDDKLNNDGTDTFLDSGEDFIPTTATRTTRTAPSLALTSWSARSVRRIRKIAASLAVPAARRETRMATRQPSGPVTTSRLRSTAAATLF